MKKALITGITGQDGAYLARLLLDKGYEVHGIVRRSSSFNTERIDDIFDRLALYHGDIGDSSSIRNVMKRVMPDEIYNLAAQSHVKVSFEEPEYTCDVVGLGTVRLLDAFFDVCPKARFYQASSSEMFGASPPPQEERTPFRPLSPYACAKVFAHNSCVAYRSAYSLFISCGILFNHESPIRGETFVTRKICRAAARIKKGLQSKLVLGNLNSVRDWGHAQDYVRAMWMMLQRPTPDDYVIATGVGRSVKDFLTSAFGEVELDWTKFVQTDPRYFRPSEVTSLIGVASKARTELGWEPEITFNEMVREMMCAEMRA